MPEAWYMKELRDRDNEIKRLKNETEELRKKYEEERKKREAAENEIKRLGERMQSKKPHLPDYGCRNYAITQEVRKKPTGRIAKDTKREEVAQVINVYPIGALLEECTFDYDRLITRIIDCRAALICYRIYRKGQTRGNLEGVPSASTYGLEVHVTLAFLLYGLELSFSQSRQILAYFCRLELTDAAVGSLMEQLANHWQSEYDTILKLIQLSYAVYIDETGWKIGKKNCYAWIFASVLHTILTFGESRSEEVLDRILPRKTFRGIGISDDYRIYEKYFRKAQKCWAHPLRKAFKLMLLFPENLEYRVFAEAIVQIFRAAKAVKRNAKLTTDDKDRAVLDLKCRIQKLCVENETKMNRDTDKDRREFVNLQKALVRTLDDLFTFVTHEVDPTNNRAERGFRKISRSRNNYQTSKSQAGAKRRSVITSVMASLRQNLKEFSFDSVVQEIGNWQKTGQSLFGRQLVVASAGLSP